MLQHIEMWHTLTPRAEKKEKSEERQREEDKRQEQRQRHSMVPERASSSLALRRESHIIEEEPRSAYF